jgi:TolB-like protein
MHPSGDPPADFGPFRLDRPGRELLRDGEVVPLGRRAFDTLAALVDADGATLTKDTLLAAVWPGLTVEENNLQVQISALRKALGDGWIITVPGRGYRLSTTPPKSPAPLAAPLQLPDLPSLVVLPFANLSDDPEQEYFADGMVEDITAALSRIGGLFVIARNSAFTYKGRAVDVRQVGRELGVRYVLEGSVRRSGNRVRISGQLVDALNGVHLWAERFDSAFEDVFDLQDRVATGVVSVIEPTIRSAEIKRAQHKPTSNLQAYDLFLRALPHCYSLAREGIEEAINLLRRAIELDPTYGLASGALAFCLYARISMGWTRAAEPELKEVVRLARIAVEHGGDDPLTLAFAANVIGPAGRDLWGAISLTERALALNPNSTIALRVMGFLQAVAGDSEMAIAYLDRAGRLNPLEGSHFLNNTISIAHFRAGRYEAAVEFAKKSLHDSPNFVPPLRRLAGLLGLLGRLKEANEAVQRLLAVAPDLTISDTRAYFEMGDISGYRESCDALCEGLRRAGLPE